MAKSLLSPSKKRRLQLHHPARNMNDEESDGTPARALYFDMLNDAEIGKLVQALSLFPRAKNWVKYISLADIAGFYFVKGPLGTYMPTLCTGLRLESRLYTSLDPVKSENEDSIRGTPHDLLRLSLPQSFTNSIRTLSVRYRCPEEHLEFLSRKFPNIEKLELGPDEGKDNSSNSSDSDDNFISIGNYWPKLLHLYLYDLHWHRSDEKSWEILGKSLKTLSVWEPANSMGIIEVVRKSCKKIKRLELSGSDADTREAITKCIVATGSQLEHVRLYMLEDEQVTRVMTACTKARFQLSTSEPLLKQSVKILKNALEEVEVIAVDDSQEEAREQFDWSACKDIKNSTFYFKPTIQDIKRFLEPPKNHLKTIDISMDGGLDIIKAAVSLIARGSGGLEEFRFSCADVSLGTFKELALANRSLCHVRIKFRNSSRENEVATDTVKSFLESPELNWLVVESKKTTSGERIVEIGRICRRLQGCRYVCITVFGQVYLY